MAVPVLAGAALSGAKQAASRPMIGRVTTTTTISKNGREITETKDSASLTGLELLLLSAGAAVGYWVYTGGPQRLAKALGDAGEQAAEGFWSALNPFD